MRVEIVDAAEIVAAADLAVEGLVMVVAGADAVVVVDAAAVVVADDAKLNLLIDSREGRRTRPSFSVSVPGL